MPATALQARALLELRRRGVVPPPPVPVHQRSSDDQALYEACEWDRAAFAKHFLPHWVPDEFNAVHLDYFRLFRERHGSRGHRDCVAAPRGSSKTTGCALVGIVHDCCYGHETFIVYVSNRFDNARDKIRQIRDELEVNQAIIRVFGSQVGDTWNQDDMMTSGGVRVLAAGRNTQIRGITNKQAQRPSKIVLDDIEFSDHVLQEEQRRKDEIWLTSDIMRLGHPGTNYEFFGTILHADSLLAKTLKNPGWYARPLYQAVRRFAAAESVPLWQQWRRLYIDISNPSHQEDAQAFFEAHHEVMLKDTEVLWPERHSYLDLMKIRVADGESSFQTELQNDPMADARYLFDLENAAYCVLRPEGIQRAGGDYIPFIYIHELVAFWDPTPEKKDVAGTDYAACPVVVKDKDGYIYCVDTYLEQEGSTSKQITAIVDLLWRWQVPLLGIESNNFQSLIVQDIREAITQRGQAEGVKWHVDLLPIVHSKSKMLRIKTLEPLLTNGWLQLARSLPSQALRQLREFIPIDGAGKDDFPDALEGACRVVRGLYDRRSAF